MSNPKNTTFSFLLIYSPIILGDLIWLCLFFSVYSRGGEVSGIFFLLMFAGWYFFNLFCMYFIEWSLSGTEYEEEKKPLREDEIRLKWIFSILFSKVKYLVMVAVNLLFITIVIESCMKGESSVWGGLIFLLVYNLLNVYFLYRTRRMRARELYRFLIMACPIIIFFIWILIA